MLLHLLDVHIIKQAVSRDCQVVVLLLDPKSLPDAILQHVALYLVLADDLFAGELLQLEDYLEAKVSLKLESLVGLFLRELIRHQIRSLLLNSLLAPYPDYHA